MSARKKINVAQINGSILIGGLIGIGFQSLTAFVIGTLFFIFCGYYTRDIR
jgi:hypothetical protein